MWRRGRDSPVEAPAIPPLPLRNSVAGNLRERTYSGSGAALPAASPACRAPKVALILPDRRLTLTIFQVSLRRPPRDLPRSPSLALSLPIRSAVPRTRILPEPYPRQHPRRRRARVRIPVPPLSNTLAEGVGFEPTERFRSAVFKTAAFSRSAIPPGTLYLYQNTPAV